MAEQHMYEPWDNQELRAQMGLAYLIGTVGMALVIALGVAVVMQAGWLQNIPSAMRRANVPGLPNVLQTELDDAFRGLTGRVASSGQSTAAMWQRGGEIPKQLPNGAPPAAGRKH